MQLAVAFKRRLVISFVAALLVSLLGLAESTPAPAAIGGSAHVQLLVKFRAKAGGMEIAKAMRSAEVSDKSIVQDLGVHVVRVQADQVDSALYSLRHSHSVLYAEADASASLFDTVPNDYWWFAEWSEQQVHGPQAWDITRGSPDVVISVLDTGMDSSQPDLQGASVPGWNTISGNSDTSDTDGHGTLAAGVAAARSNNGIGVASLCWLCKLMPVKVLGTGGSLSSVANGITWATDHGARVISMSWGYRGADYVTLHSAIQYAHNHNVVLVAAAGNYGDTVAVYPAAYPEVLGVAMTDPNDQLYSASSYGSWVKLAAPGYNYSTGLNGWYGPFSGTSSAAPFIAGIVGLTISLAPLASNTQIEQALESSALGIGTGVQYGRADAYAALRAVGGGGGGSGSAPVTSAAPTISGTAQDGQTLTGSTGTWSGSTPMSFGYQWRRCDAAGTVCANLTGASASTYAVSTADVGSTLRLAVTASNTYGTATAVTSPTAVVTTAPASAPTSSTMAFSGSLNKKQDLRVFTLTVGSGVANAQLAFSRASTMTLTVERSDGSTVGRATGASVLPLILSLPAGTYSYLVSGGNGNASFSLTVAYASP